MITVRPDQYNQPIERFPLNRFLRRNIVCPPRGYVDIYRIRSRGAEFSIVTSASVFQILTSQLLFGMSVIEKGDLLLLGFIFAAVYHDLVP